VDQIDKMLSLTGFPSEEDIKSLESDVAKSMLKESKITYSGSQAKVIFKDLPPQFSDLLQRMFTFNPNKRILIE
jgi:serine/threonine protein kinase